MTSAASTNSSNRSALPVLDMQNRAGILQLCSCTTFSFVNVSIVNDTATGAGGGMAVFRGQQDSKVNVLGGAHFEVSMPATSSTVANVLHHPTKRPVPESTECPLGRSGECNLQGNLTAATPCHHGSLKFKLNMLPM